MLLEQKSHSLVVCPCRVLTKCFLQEEEGAGLMKSPGLPLLSSLGLDEGEGDRGSYDCPGFRKKF